MRTHRKCSRFDLDNLFPIAMIIVILGIVLSYGLNIMGDIKSDMRDDLTVTIINNETETSLTNSSRVACNFVDTGTTYYILANSTGMAVDEDWTYIGGVNLSISEGGRVTIYYENVKTNVSKINYGCAVTSTEYNASQDAIDGVAKIPEKLPLIVTVIVAAIIIGILTKYLMIRYT